MQSRDGRQRPFITLEPTDHPLAVEPREGIAMSRVEEFLGHVLHREHQVAKA